MQERETVEAAAVRDGGRYYFTLSPSSSTSRGGTDTRLDARLELDLPGTRKGIPSKLQLSRGRLAIHIVAIIRRRY